MVGTPTDLPDWTRGYLLIGQDADGDPVVLLVDSDGQLQVLLRGEDADGDPQTVQVDSDGQLYTVLRGADDVDVSVDADGFLTVVLKGITAGAALKTLLVDDDGRAIMVPRGESGAYMLVDEDGYLTTVLKGATSGAALKTLLVDDDGRAIMVPRGESGAYMLVDEDGYLTAVLKGQSGGALTTITVDSNGRIQAYLVDAEDQWGKTIVTGNAGQAAKQGSLQNWDYRGQPYYQTTFDKGAAPWLKYPEGAGSAITIDPTMWLSGGYSLKMVAGSDGDHKAYVDALIQRPPSGRTGCEIVWSKDGTTAYVTIELRLYTGGRVYSARLRYSNVNDRMEYYTSGGAWAAYGNPYFMSIKESFNRMKLVVDVEAHNYSRLMWAQTEQSMAGVPIRDIGGGYLNAMYVRIEHEGRDGNNDVIYLDRVILTAGE